MKKFVSIIMAAALTLSLAACGGNAAQETTGVAAQEMPTSALEVLETVWADYAEDEKFPVGGGSGESMVMDAPGAMDMADTETLDFMVGLPVDSAAMVDDAASALHMMNANTFTAGCFRVTDSANVETVVKALQENIQARQWMCGIPEGLVIYTVGNYVVSAFGAQELLDVFTAHLTATFEGATQVVAEPIA